MTATNDQRARVLTAIRRSLKRGPLTGERLDAVQRRTASPPRGPVPARGQLGREEIVQLFQQMAEEAAATTQRLETMAEVPSAVLSYLQGRNEAAQARLAPHPDLTGLDWQGSAPLLQVDQGRGESDTDMGVSRSFAGVAETGTLLLYSRETSPTTLNFLPATHVVVVRAAEVLGTFEDAWDRLRARLGRQGNGAWADHWPRTVNLITGPSRTADIEQTLQLGAHGPMNLHVLVVGAADAEFGGDERG
ncbi:LutC/YkgG family protein [Rhodovibrio salinarum]|uniref:Lactate utilization protein n=1 Tax=Rhodovibrio salinarum TaxID=1087 RepID=A0A934QH20_9PROT|nr:lactate utilization protein [Rhodovibrio salinarum]MBK1696871.1 lactate utilization protein [Rhodovibrio salinarum]